MWTRIGEGWAVADVAEELLGKGFGEGEDVGEEGVVNIPGMHDGNIGMGHVGWGSSWLDIAHRVSILIVLGNQRFIGY